jgi:L-rhamnose isomerase
LQSAYPIEILCLNEHWLSPNDIDVLSIDNYTVAFNFKEISYNDARDAILALSSSNAKDVYHINSKIIKTLVNVIYIPLTKIFNKCIAENVFPNVLKISKVIPLFKKGIKTT